MSMHLSHSYLILHKEEQITSLPFRLHIVCLVPLLSAHVLNPCEFLSL